MAKDKFTLGDMTGQPGKTLEKTSSDFKTPANERQIFPRSVMDLAVNKTITAAEYKKIEEFINEGKQRKLKFFFDYVPEGKNFIQTPALEVSEINMFFIILSEHFDFFKPQLKEAITANKQAKKENKAAEKEFNKAQLKKQINNSKKEISVPLLTAEAIPNLCFTDKDFSEKDLAILKDSGVNFKAYYKDEKGEAYSRTAYANGSFSFRNTASGESFNVEEALSSNSWHCKGYSSGRSVTIYEIQEEFFAIIQPDAISEKYGISKQDYFYKNMFPTLNSLGNRFFPVSSEHGTAGRKFFTVTPFLTADKKFLYILKFEDKRIFDGWGKNNFLKFEQIVRLICSPDAPRFLFKLITLLNDCKRRRPKETSFAFTVKELLTSIGNTTELKQKNHLKRYFFPPLETSLASLQNFCFIKNYTVTEGSVKIELAQAKMTSKIQIFLEDKSLEK